MASPLKIRSAVYLCGAPVVWAAHFLLCYVLVALSCSFGWPQAMVPGIAGITLAAVAALATLAWLSYRARRRPVNEETVLFARVSLGLCALSAVALLWVAFPATVLPSCVA